MAHHERTDVNEMTWREHLSLRGFVAGLPRLPTREQRQANGSMNVFKTVASLTPMQHLMFFSGWYAWTMDAVDFFAVSLTVTKLAAQFGKTNADITLAITLTLLFRSLGAAIFGLLGDRYGRKWVLVANLLIISALELGSGFVTTMPQFLAVRSLFGIGMGGIWGLSASTALENLPVSARGLYSGILQQGYAVGYLISALINLYLVNPRNDWTLLFKVGAGLSLGAAILRAFLPESKVFIEANERRKAEAAAGIHTQGRTVTFFKEAGRALKTYWARCIIAVLLMTGFNFFSHGSQDLYPTLIQARGFTSDQATKATIVGNVGAVVGGTICGALSQFLGRRITIILACVWTMCFLPLWYLPNSIGGLMAGAFTVQMGVQGAWGVIPVFLQELSPPAFRAVWPGLAYQLGNAASSASSQIEATAGESITTANGKPDYGRIGVILVAVVAAWIILITLITPEAHGSHFEHAKTAFEKDGGAGVIVDADDHDYVHRDVEAGKSSEEKIDDIHTPATEKRPSI